MNRTNIQILVCNPGTHPEMMQLGAALSGPFSIVYATSSNFPQDTYIMRLLEAARSVVPTIANQFLRRRLPKELTRSEVKYAGVLAELAFQIVKRTFPGWAKSSHDLRNRVFGGRISSFVAGWRPRLVFGQYTGSLDVFEAVSDNCVRVLNYPTAHHRWLAKAIDAEAARNPAWSTLLGTGYESAAEMVRLDREVELADKILVPSTFAARTFTESGVDKSKLIVIPLGCEVQSDLDTSKLPEKRDYMDILYAGRVTQRKGIGYLVDAVEKFPEGRLTIIGDCSPESRSLLDQHPKVQLLPSVPREHLLERMREADVVVLPSLADGFGLVAIEAMSVGAAVLVSHETFAGDLIEDGINGFLLPTTSAGCIAQQLKRIHEFPQIQELRHQAALTARGYPWLRYRASILCLAESILGTALDTSAQKC